MGNTLNDDIATIERFAAQHELDAELDGQAGSFRPLVGYTRRGSWVLYEPFNLSTYAPLPGWTPEEIRKTCTLHAYEKWPAVAVEVRDGEVNAAIAELAQWTRELEALDVECEDYETRAIGLQKLVSSAKGCGMRVKAAAKQ